MNIKAYLWAHVFRGQHFSSNFWIVSYAELGHAFDVHVCGDHITVTDNWQVVVTYSNCIIHESHSIRYQYVRGGHGGSVSHLPRLFFLPFKVSHLPLLRIPAPTPRIPAPVLAVRPLICCARIYSEATEVRVLTLHIHNFVSNLIWSKLNSMLIKKLKK